jgi:hypothetical protein
MSHCRQGYRQPIQFSGPYVPYSVKCKGIDRCASSDSRISDSRQVSLKVWPVFKHWSGVASVRRHGGVMTMSDGEYICHKKQYKIMMNWSWVSGDTGWSANACKIHACTLNKGGISDPGMRSLCGCACTRTRWYLIYIPGTTADAIYWLWCFWLNCH